MHPQRLRQRDNLVLIHWTCFGCKLVTLYATARLLSEHTQEWLVPRPKMFCPHCLHMHEIHTHFLPERALPVMEVREPMKVVRRRKPRAIK